MIAGSIPFEAQESVSGNERKEGVASRLGSMTLYKLPEPMRGHAWPQAGKNHAIVLMYKWVLAARQRQNAKAWRVQLPGRPFYGDFKQLLGEGEFPVGGFKREI